MLASTPCARLTSHTTYSTSSCATSRASCSGASSLHTSGTIRISSATPSSVCWYAGLRSAATRPASFSGDCRTRVCCPRNLPRSVRILSAPSTLPVVTNAPSPPVMAARVLTGTSSRTGVAPTAALPTTTTKSYFSRSSC